MSENWRQSETNVLFSNKFKLTVNIVLSNLCHSEYSKCPPLEKSARLVNGIVINALFHCSTQISQDTASHFWTLKF